MKRLLAATLILALSSVAFGFEYAYCQLRPTSNNPTLYGYIEFQTSATQSNAIDMYVNIGGITQNTGVSHGIHIHEFGDLKDTVGAASVGSHYNPAGVGHGCPDEGSATWHDGDTGNWPVSGTGTIVGNKTLTLSKLSGITSIIGRAVVVHNRTDDCLNTTSSQSRLGFCVIGIGNPTYVGQTGNNATNDATSVPIGVCDLQPIAGSGVSGRVWITPHSTGVTVDAIVNGLSGIHGFHIHQYGDLRLNDTGNSAGGHYNPTGNNHGIPPYDNRHLGDMGNLYYAANATTLAYSYNFSIDGSAPIISLTGLNNVIGRAIIVHADADNCSQPTGGSGSRLAYCVIGIGNTTTTSMISQYPSVGTTQNATNCVLLASPSVTPSPSASPSTSPSASSSATASPSSGASELPSASSSPGSDSFGSKVVPCFVAVAGLVWASIF